MAGHLSRAREAYDVLVDLETRQVDPEAVASLRKLMRGSRGAAFRKFTNLFRSA